MVEALCHRCGREWDYTGGSDYYGTCPNCNTSVKLNRGSERAEPSPSPEGPDGPEATAERCPDPSDRLAESVEIEAGGEAREVGVVEAVEAVDSAVVELYELGDSQSETVSELAQEAGDRGDRLDDLEDGLEELAGYFADLVESFDGGEVDYEHIENTGDPIPEALKEVDMEGSVA